MYIFYYILGTVALTDYLLLAFAALIGSTLAGVTGFGGAAILLPVLIHQFGARHAIPILTVAQLIGNGSRVYFHRKELDWKVIGHFAIAAVPGALIGGYVFSRVSNPILMRMMGGFLIATVAWRWTGFSKMTKMPLKGFVGVGLGFSFLSALVGSVGPFIVPFFLSYGLVKGAFISTEAMCTVVMHIFKLIAYKQGSVLTTHAVLIGLALGPLMVMGSWLGKKLIHRMPEKVFVVLVELTLVAAGLNFLIRG